MCALACLAAAQPARARPSFPWLHAVRGENARFEDARGREFTFRGVNVNQLVDYFKLNEHPENVPLTRSDLANIRKLGFTSIRLLMSWSLLEPQPGQIDASYLDRVVAAVEQANAEGIYVVLDMHQDAWGKFVAASPTEVCPPGFQPNRGWDGAPEWATFTDGQPRCAAGGTRELSPAVAQAWENFWNDRQGPGGAGIETRFVAAWRAVAARFAGDSGVAAYDVLNEPEPGLVPQGRESETLAPMYRRAIAAIRQVDSRHVVFVEPTVLRDLTPGAIVMPAISDDPNLAYSPHIYGDVMSSGRADEAEWTHAREEAAQAGGDAGALPVWIGEYAGVDSDAGEDYNRAFQEYAEKYRIGWSQWVWKETCGNPHAGYATTPPGSINVYDCAHDRFTGLQPHRVKFMVRPYPVFAPGRLTALSYAVDSKRFEARGTAPRASGSPGLRVVVPLKRGYGSRRHLAIATSGLGRVALKVLRDGNAILTARAKRGDWRVTLTRK